ncbi:uncharacterized protein LOC141611200 [Silene latifolia]|uniref:uncharacterized protein LOC141611200 n=1 Tax=Silene latifolia TaxID=37657 RepID=UPI003D779466
MVNMMSSYKTMLHNVMKLAGMRTKQVEIEPETIMHFWVPSKTNNNKPNIVLVHGFQADGILTWQFQVLSLRKKYNVYVPDLLFFGKSFTSRSERSTRFQADCLAIGLKKLGLEKNCVYVGFSYGGMVGFQLAEHHPELVGSMVITDSVLAETESISNKALERVGCSNWSDCLMPTTVEGVKVSVDISSNKKNFPKMPDYFFKHYLKVSPTLTLNWFLLILDIDK